VADSLHFAIRIVELNELFAPLTVVESVVSQKELSVFSLGHIGETHYVLTSVSKKFGGYSRFQFKKQFM